jgi:hypothetical protein
MNKRTFLKTATLGAAIAVSSIPSIVNLTLDSKESIPLYQQFDWVSKPLFKAVRFNKINDKTFEIILSPEQTVKTTRLVNIKSDPSVNLTEEKINLNDPYFISSHWFEVNEVCSNETLLREVQKLGITHIYRFETIVSLDNTRHYFVRGAKLPEYKSENNIRFKCV